MTNELELEPVKKEDKKDRVTELTEIINHYKILNDKLDKVLEKIKNRKCGL